MPFDNAIKVLRILPVPVLTYLRWSPSHVEETMSTRSQRGINETSMNKQYRSPRVTLKNRAPKPQITYDYDAAVSQPDVPNLLQYKNKGLSLTVSGVPRKRRTLKTSIRSRIMLSKNFQKRPHQYRKKSMVERNANARTADNKTVNHATNTVVLTGTTEEEKDVGEKENLTSNGTVNVDKSSNFLRTTAANGVNEAQNTEKKVRSEKLDDCKNTALKSPDLQIKGSRIPRVKMMAFPVHTAPEFSPEKKIGMNDKRKDCGNFKCPTANRALDDVEIAEVVGKDGTSVKREQNVIRFKEFEDDPRIVLNGETASTLEADEETDDRGLESTDESPAIISNIDDRRVLTILRNLKLNCPCKSCADHDPLSTSRQEGEDNLKSLQAEGMRKKKWSHRHRKYVYASSENVDASSDYNSESSRKKRKSRSKTKSNLTQRIKTNSVVTSSPKVSNRRRSNFSFLNTLFDIVFWPYLVLKTNR